MSTINDVLTIIVHGISEAFDIKHISRAIALFYLERIGKGRRGDCYINALAMEYLEEFFPSGRSMKAIVYGKYSEARGIYIGVLQGYFSGSSLFPFHILKKKTA